MPVRSSTERLVSRVRRCPFGCPRKEGWLAELASSVMCTWNWDTGVCAAIGIAVFTFLISVSPSKASVQSGAVIKGRVWLPCRRQVTWMMSRILGGPFDERDWTLRWSVFRRGQRPTYILGRSAYWSRWRREQPTFQQLATKHVPALRKVGFFAVV